MELTQYQSEILVMGQFVGGLVSMGIGYLIVVNT